MRRVSNLVVYAIAGTGALAGSAAVTSFADRPDVFVSVLFLASLVLGLVAATCIGAEATIMQIDRYLAHAADQVREMLGKVPGRKQPLPPEMFSWENQSTSRPDQLSTLDTVISWGGSALEIFVVILLAGAAAFVACSLYFAQEAARTGTTSVLLGLNIVVGVAILLWASSALPHWRDKKRDIGSAKRVVPGEPTSSHGH